MMADHHSPSHDLVSLRALVATREAGIIIGRAGKTIQAIRDATHVRIRLSDAVARCPERVLTVSGSPISVGDAFGMIAQKLQEEPQSPTDHPSHHPSHLPQIKLLIPHALMGAIIGKNGSTIQHIQTSSHCRLLASEAVLPHSTDRAVTLSGAPSTLQAAAEQIAGILAPMQEPRGHIAYQPGRRDPPSALADGEQQTQVISIPNDMVGAIIGRAGARINEIRMKSGAQVRIGEAAEDAVERTVTISGGAEAIKMALYMLYGRLEHEKRKAQEYQEMQGGMEEGGVPEEVEQP